MQVLGETRACIEVKGSCRTGSTDHCEEVSYPPATSTSVERLFSAAGLIMEAKQNRLCPDKLNQLLFVRKGFLLGVIKPEW